MAFPYVIAKTIKPYPIGGDVSLPAAIQRVKIFHGN